MINYYQLNKFNELLAALLLIGATSAPAFAGGPRPYYRGQRNVHYEEKCYKNVERYIPGHYDDFGNWKVGRVKTTLGREFLAADCMNDPENPTFMNIIITQMLVVM